MDEAGAANARTVGTPAVSYEVLSEFLIRIESIRLDGKTLQTQHREFAVKVAEVTPIFPWASARSIVEELSEESLRRQSVVGLRAAMAKDVLATTSRVTESYGELQARALDLPAETWTMKQVGLLFSLALAAEKRTIESWGDHVVYGGRDDASTAILLLANATSLLNTADEWIAAMLADANAEHLKTLHESWLSQPELGGSTLEFQVVFNRRRPLCDPMLARRDSFPVPVDSVFQQAYNLAASSCLFRILSGALRRIHS